MSDTINDGGPAFPRIPYIGEEARAFGVPDDICTSGHPGMTLRDWFAGQALCGMLTYYNEHRGDYHTNATVDGAANDAYAWADAMIAARSKK